jgi:hypothetical protein
LADFVEGAALALEDVAPDGARGVEAVASAGTIATEDTSGLALEGAAADGGLAALRCVVGPAATAAALGGAALGRADAVGGSDGAADGARNWDSTSGSDVLASKDGAGVWAPGV